MLLNFLLFEKLDTLTLHLILTVLAVLHALHLGLHGLVQVGVPRHPLPAQAGPLPPDQVMHGGNLHHIMDQFTPHITV